MPPPVEEWSDEESGDIPFTTAPETKEATNNVEEEDKDEDDDDEEEGVFVVEEIKKHQYEVDGTLYLFVKWKDWPAIKDHTWEPESGLKEGAEDVLDAYYKKIGGRPDNPAEKPAEKGAKGPGRKRKSMAEKKETTAATPTETKRRRQSAPKNEPKDDVKADANTPAESEDDEPSDWVPKTQNWDKEVESVDTIIRDANDQGLYALLLWTNGKRSRIHIQSCYERCPMKMLKFYEKHLVFKDG
ncbi:unnamed protein product [Penicillium pancosmium]